MHTCTIARSLCRTAQNVACSARWAEVTREEGFRSEQNALATSDIDLQEKAVNRIRGDFIGCVDRVICDQEVEVKCRSVDVQVTS